MQATFSRRDFALGAVVVALGGSDAFAATEDELAWLRFGASGELVAERFWAGAARARVLTPAERRRVREASRARLLAVGRRIKRALVGLNLGATAAISPTPRFVR